MFIQRNNSELGTSINIKLQGNMASDKCKDVIRPEMR